MHVRTLRATVSARISNDFNYNFVIAASQPRCFNKSVGDAYRCNRVLLAVRE